MGIQVGPRPIKLARSLINNTAELRRLEEILAMLRFVILLLLLSLNVIAAAEPAPRVFSFEYKTTIDSIEAGSGPLHIFIPLAVANDQQLIVSERVDASIAGQIEVETHYGNRYWHGSLQQTDGKPVQITVTTTIERRAFHVEKPRLSRAVSDQEQIAMAKFLGPNARVLVDHPVLKPILAEVKQSADSDNPAAISRAIYDWVVDNVEYKKVGTGWGNGDTFWACNERYGNCTDFHALFISLARSENIPARFEIGFPVPDSRDAGAVAGYHCWVQFYLPDVGWFPIDASEAFKQPEKKEYFYGAHPQDRIHFSTGRDIKLGASHQTAPLNYFVYPHIEVAGKVFTGKVNNQFSYKNVIPESRDLLGLAR
jgi:transglutaminase-like putative cysteine protease